MAKFAIASREISPIDGPFSQAIEVGGFLFLSGQIGQDPATGELVRGGTEAEIEQVFRNLEAVLEAAGRKFDDVVRASVFLSSMSDFATVNDIYARYFDKPFPVRTTVAVVALPLGAAVEVDLVVKS